MPPPNITTSLDFLNDAAHLLVTTAPETSAYLMSRRNELTCLRMRFLNPALKENMSAAAVVR